MTTPTLSDLSPEARGLLETQTIELPSWAFGNSGTRFRVFTTAGVPRDPFEKIDDVARVNAFTGITPRVSLHIPWDRTDDYEALRAHAEERGVTIGTRTRTTSSAPCATPTRGSAPRRSPTTWSASTSCGPPARRP